MAGALRPYHVVLWGATGFTGRLVAEHLATSYHGTVKWAIAGRSRDRLEKLRESLSVKCGIDKDTIPILLGDLEDPNSLQAALSQANVVITTAGPYSKMGTPIVDAALQVGTHYVDITGKRAGGGDKGGESPWVASIIKKYHEAAKSKGIRIIPCCAYDSVPSDLGALLVANHAKEKLGKKLAKLTMVVVTAKGGMSGGTIASGMAAASGPKEFSHDHGVYSLVPPSAKGQDTEYWGVRWSPDVKKYLTGFFMQICNNRVVHRSNYFLGYGDDLRYEETVAVPSWLIAQGTRAAVLAFGLALRQTWLHGVLLRFLPSPGEGPSEAVLKGGRFKHLYLATTQEEPGVQPTNIKAEAGWDHGDPGYWGGARLVLEAALCLALQADALDADEHVQSGGVLTPATGLGVTLIERLRAADFYFNILDSE